MSTLGTNARAQAALARIQVREQRLVDQAQAMLLSAAAIQRARIEALQARQQRKLAMRAGLSQAEAYRQWPVVPDLRTDPTGTQSLRYLKRVDPLAYVRLSMRLYAQRRRVRELAAHGYGFVVDGWQRRQLVCLLCRHQWRWPVPRRWRVIHRATCTRPVLPLRLRPWPVEVFDE